MIVQFYSLCICWIPGVLGKGKFTRDLETARRPRKAARGRSNRTKMLTIKAILPNRTFGKMHTHPWRQSPQVIWKSFWLNKQYTGEKISLGGLLLAYIWNSNSFIHVYPLQILAVLCHFWSPGFSCNIKRRKESFPEGNLLQTGCSGGSSGLKEITIRVIPLKSWLDVLPSIWSPGEYPHLSWKNTRKGHYS